MRTINNETRASSKLNQTFFVSEEEKVRNPIANQSNLLKKLGKREKEIKAKNPKIKASVTLKIGDW